MKATIGHIGINLSNEEESFPFWKELLTYLGFELMLDGNHFDAKAGETFLCFSVTKTPHQDKKFHRKTTGLNHVALKVSSPELVDEFAEDYLKPRNIPTLYGGAKAYPEYAEGYYAVYFEDPDRIKIEVVYEGAN
jgi:catechol 2,3-dioxygenase-like lactoylglutathione lyase family enzyme